VVRYESLDVTEVNFRLERVDSVSNLSNARMIVMEMIWKKSVVG
jgi:hypothetical protein